MAHNLLVIAVLVIKSINIEQRSLHNRKVMIKNPLLIIHQTVTLHMTTRRKFSSCQLVFNP
jgi:hypothetical protein